MTPPAPSMDESLLSAYLDGELDAETRAAVDERLSVSPEWRTLLVEVREARDAVRALPPVDAPPGFWAAVLDEDRTVVDLAEVRARRRARTARWAGLAGATAAAAILAVTFVPRSHQVHPPLGTMTQVHAQRASLSDDAISNLAGSVVPESFRP